MHWIASKTMVENSLALEFSERFLSTFNLKNNKSNLINALNKLENTIHKNKYILKKLLIKMSEEWLIEQLIWDSKLDDEQMSWTDNVNLFIIII